MANTAVASPTEGNRLVRALRDIERAVAALTKRIEVLEQRVASLEQG